MAMPTFLLAYKVTNPSKNYLNAELIALGTRQNKAEGKPVIEFIKAGWGGLGGYRVIGEFKKLGEGIFELADERKGDDDKPVVWRFEQLTVENWTPMGDHIHDFKRLSAQVTTDFLLQNYYVSDWLPDNWEEHPEG